MKLIAGLGNYGKRYESTYHNLGFLALDYIADELGIEFKKKECDSITAKKSGLILAKPLTYMNLSGVAIKKLLDKYDIGVEDLVVIYDDIDVRKGEIRFRERGSGGTHNGMRSIIYEIDSENFKRIRIGASRQDKEGDLADYVLSDIPSEERVIYDKVFKEVHTKVRELIDA